MKIWTKILVGLAALLLLAACLPAQSIFATLTGVVSDPSGAVVPHAKVKLHNTQSGSDRETVSNAEGYFSFSSVPVGDTTYELSAEAKGFVTYKAGGLLFGGGEKRNVNITLKVGSTAETVEVTGVVDNLVPVDSGEKSSTLTTRELQNYSVVGRNAAEFIKILPGFSITGTGTENRANFTGETIGINGNGDGGSQSPLNGAFSVNGTPGNSLDITADGAHVSDPGCNCATPVNPNTDMISEFKVLTSNFSAESQKGPAVISSVAKSGGRDFHGAAYLYARHYALNANDWLNNKLGQPLPSNKYFFPGGNISGPVLIPGTRINKNRDKLFFFSGFEEYLQTLDTGILRGTVPTDGMIAGNFSPAELSKLGKVTAGGGAPTQLDATKYPTGIIPAAQLDPGGVAMAKLLPRPTSNSDATGGYNYVSQQVFDQNSLQWMSRVDYNISDNTKLYLRYNMQREKQLFPVGLWWRNGNQVPYPTPVAGKNSSDSLTASLTHVFSPTMTNEFVFGYTKIAFPNVFDDPKKVQRASVGFPYQTLYKNGVTQIPSITGWGGEFATLLNPGGFEYGGGARGLFADKWLPTVSDTVSKVWGTHTVKLGFFYEWIRNSQPANNNTNGQSVFANNAGWAGGGTTGAAYGDLMTGWNTQYNEANFTNLHDESYSTVEGFVQDSWKVSRKLTLELGLRVSHLGPWTDRTGNGFSIFDYTKYSSTASPLTYPGFLWNKKDPSVPLTGFPTRAAYYAPRFGVAYDLFGKGATVLRGGWGRFFYHNGQFTSGMDVSAGVYQTTLSGVFYKDFAGINPANSPLGNPQAVDSKDDKSQYPASYSFTIAQRMPWSSMLEVAYVGNQSKDLFNTSAPGPGNNPNMVPYGALFNRGVDPNSSTIQDLYRPFQGFTDIGIATHNLYQNYNSMQATWVRSKGRYNINMNYTFGKAMGIVGTYDQFQVNNNYGVMGANRKHVFNAAYSIELGNFTKSKMAGAFVNGWQLSGITQIESGINLAPNSSNFNVNLNGFAMPGTISSTNTAGYSVSSATIFGTRNISLQPLRTCNPTSGLGSNQYVNGNCFAIPTQVGQGGPEVGMPIYGPAFFNSDLGLFKNFQLSESKKIQLRFNAYNFMNHPLWSFINGSNNLNLTFNGTTGALSNPKFGTVTEKQGRRIVQLAVKFYF